MTSPLRDAQLVEDAAGGASVHSVPQVNVSVLPATCVENDSLMVKRVYNSGTTVKSPEQHLFRSGSGSSLNSCAT